ncbi:MAG TPA: hypothetical protein EYH41_13525 [Novosphingobium capsulatum]|jgi:hypothetical protein|nr:hypothetical protein [Novosphingobium aromaticivorans]HIQ18985.1 hypothetical protein [Novosphingobium capsulatum]
MSIMNPAIRPTLAGGAVIGLVCKAMWLVHGRVAGIVDIARLSARSLASGESSESRDAIERHCSLPDSNPAAKKFEGIDVGIGFTH